MPRLYCIPPCIRAHGLPCLRGAACLGAQASADPSTPGAGALCQTPRGGSNRRPGGANKTGAPLAGRESKNLGAVAALFVRADSHYKTMPDVDAWDIERDARRWPGGCPLVAHPPCRAWCRMRDKARPRADEMELARQAVRWVRQFGGVLEHPAHSTLWADMGMCKPRRGSQRGQRDAWGGWTLPISQHWFGYRAEKMTWLYVVGCEPGNVPALPLDLADPPRVVAQLKGRNGNPRPRKGDQGWRPEVTRTERERTPPALASWLVELARRCDEARPQWGAIKPVTVGAACA